MQLAQIQRDFAAAVRDAALPPPHGVEGGRDDAHRRDRFNIYRNNVFVMLVDLLDARFPVVSRLTGSDFFRAMARVYADRAPPGPSLLDYGASFAPFIAEFGPARDTPYLADVARIEWARHEAYYAADANALTAARFAELHPNGGAVVHLHPAVRVHASPYPIHAIWRRNAHADDPERSALPSRGEAVLVTRPKHDVGVREIGHAGAAFVAALAKRRSIAGAFVQARDVAADFSLESVLRDLLISGAIVGFDLDPSSRHPTE